MYTFNKKITVLLQKKSHDFFKIYFSVPYRVATIIAL